MKSHYRLVRQQNRLLALFDEEIQDLRWLHLRPKEAEALVGAEEVRTVQEASVRVAEEWRDSALEKLVFRYGFDHSWYRVMQMGQPAPAVSREADGYAEEWDQAAVSEIHPDQVRGADLLLMSDVLPTFLAEKEGIEIVTVDLDGLVVPDCTEVLEHSQTWRVWVEESALYQLEPVPVEQLGSLRGETLVLLHDLVAQWVEGRVEAGLLVPDHRDATFAHLWGVITRTRRLQEWIKGPQWYLLHSIS